MAEDHPTQSRLWDTGEPLKRCPRCREMKPLSGFRLSVRKGRRRRHSYCIPCGEVVIKACKGRTKEKDAVRERKRKLRKAYGLSEADFQSMVDKQHGLCALCGKPPTIPSSKGFPPRLYVDHSHQTGKVRDLLCLCCNIMLGQANDDPALLRAAADYLERHQG